MTQVEEVAVNSPVKNPALCPSRRRGQGQQRSPDQNNRREGAATMRVALRLRLRIKLSRSQSAHFLIKALASLRVGWKRF